MVESNDIPKPPPPLASPIRLILALSALCSTLHPPVRPSSHTLKWHQAISSTWLASVCKHLEFDTGRLPPSIDVESVQSSAADQREEWTAEDRVRMAGVLVEASLAVDAEKKDQKEGALRYTPVARALAHQTLMLLGLPAKELLPEAEKNLSLTLFTALKAAQKEDTQEKVESTRAAHSQGWGGSLGRHIATGAGVIAGGVLIGVTGGLAAPAILAVLAPLGVGGLFSAAAAPVVLGTLFGVGGGGLAGKRVRERWRGVQEFGFVEVGTGTRATKEEIEDLIEARKHAKERAEAQAAEKAAKGNQASEKAGGAKEEKDLKSANLDAEKPLVETKAVDPDTKAATKDEKALLVEKDEAENGEAELVDDADDEQAEAEAAKGVEDDRAVLEDKLLKLTLEAGTQSSVSFDSTSRRESTDVPRPSLDQGLEEKALAEAKRPPSLTATVVVPGLLTVSRTEAITAWRAICSANPPVAGGEASAIIEKGEEDKQASGTSAKPIKTFKDGRDVYLLRFESEAMLKTGRDIDFWVGTKIKGKIKGKVKSEILKRTFLAGYYAAVALPKSVYSFATTALDNTWEQAQSRAMKAGRLLGEVLEKRVQGERPVVLIGSSLGALTVMQALLYLSNLSSAPVPAYVESAYLISLPSSPPPEEWAQCRGVVARRLVNAWSGSDLVLAGVVRLHEVVSRATTLQSGMTPAGLGPVGLPGVQDVDVSSVLNGHMELQTKIGEVLRIIDVDA